MNTKGCVIVLFLCFLVLFTITDCSTCQKNILEGDSLTFKLTDRLLKDDDRFSIKKDNKMVVPKRNRKQEGLGIVKNDSLEFQHVNLSYSGTYSVEVFDVNGTNIKSYSEIVCVYAKVPKPRVNITCQNETVDFRCDVEGDEDQRSNISYSWHKNGKEFKKNGLNFSINIEAYKSVYTCTAQNLVHTNTSDPVEVACSDTLFGFDHWTMIGIYAGGGLVLLLTIVLVTVACCRCKRRKKQQRELSHNYINITSSPGQQKQQEQTAKQTASHQLVLPDTSDNDSAQVVAQAGSMEKLTQPPLDHSIDVEEEQHPPLPKPRKNAPVKKCEGPL